MTPEVFAMVCYATGIGCGFYAARRHYQNKPSFEFRRQFVEFTMEKLTAAGYMKVIDTPEGPALGVVDELIQAEVEQAIRRHRPDLQATHAQESEKDK